MKRTLELIREHMKEKFCRRYDAVHFATGVMRVIKAQHGNKKLYSAAEVLELLELVALDPEREDVKGGSKQI